MEDNENEFDFGPCFYDEAVDTEMKKNCLYYSPTMDCDKSSCQYCPHYEDYRTGEFAEEEEVEESPCLGCMFYDDDEACRNNCYDYINK